jgi:hypothetical protein
MGGYLAGGEAITSAQLQECCILQMTLACKVKIIVMSSAALQLCIILIHYRCTVSSHLVNQQAVGTNELARGVEG